MVIAVCDDNALFLKEIEGQIKTLSPADNVFTFDNLEAFLLSIDKGRRYNAVLMDIEWDDKATGMDAAAKTYELNPEARIIFVTGCVERYSQQIFLNRANLSGYLTKPVDAGLLRANLQKVADAPKFGEQPSLVLRQKGAPVSISVNDIYFIESKRHTVNVHTEEETVTAYDQLDNVMRSLPTGFFQCHKSFIVNMSRIRRFQNGEIILKNDACVPVSRSKYSETKEAYFRFMGQTF